MLFFLTNVFFSSYSELRVPRLVIFSYLVFNVVLCVAGIAEGGTPGHLFIRGGVYKNEPSGIVPL